jgi:S1-C subfamily serine protease
LSGARRALGLTALAAASLATGPERVASADSAPAVAAPSVDPARLESALSAVVMVIAVDRVHTELRPMAGGSGVIVDPDGWVLTSDHILRAGDRARDLFVIARYRGRDREPEMTCAGRPEHARRLPERDLALIRCDRDMDGNPRRPARWPSAAIGGPASPGDRVWVLGYPDTGAGRPTVVRGQITGKSGVDGAPGEDYLNTDAPLSHGSSGGAAIDADGALIGLASAFRERAQITADAVRPAGRVGLIRPIAHAMPLLATDASPPTPPGTAAPATSEPATGVVIRSAVVDAANDHPVTSAVVIVFKPHVRKRDVDLHELHDQALAWGRSNISGSFALDRPIPRGARYTVAVLASGYHPLIVDDVLSLDGDSPDYLDPWGIIRLSRE